MPKKLQIWIGRPTTLMYDRKMYHGHVSRQDSYYRFSEKNFLSNPIYSFKTDDGQTIPIVANGKNKVRALEGRLIVPNAA